MKQGSGGLGRLGGIFIVPSCHWLGLRRREGSGGGEPLALQRVPWVGSRLRDHGLRGQNGGLLAEGKNAFREDRKERICPETH